MASSIKSTALEPTRAELAGLSAFERVKRLVPVYGLVILTVAARAPVQRPAAGHVPDAVEPPLDHLRQGDHRHPLARRDDPDGRGQDRPDGRLRHRAVAHSGDQPADPDTAFPGRSRCSSCSRSARASGSSTALLVEVAQIDAFIATLGTGTILYAIAMWHSKGRQIVGVAPGRLLCAERRRSCSACRSPASTCWRSRSRSGSCSNICRSAAISMRSAPIRRPPSSTAFPSGATRSSPSSPRAS